MNSYNKEMNKLKRRINSTERTNIYNLSENINDNNNKKPKFVTLFKEKVNNQEIQMQRFERLNNYNINNNNKNLFYNNNLNLELKEAIEKLKNELNEKNKIINNFAKIISDYKGKISILMAKNKNLGEKILQN